MGDDSGPKKLRICVFFVISLAFQRIRDEFQRCDLQEIAGVDDFHGIILQKQENLRFVAITGDFPDGTGESGAEILAIFQEIPQNEDFLRKNRCFP